MIREKFSGPEWQTVVFGPQQVGSAIIFCSPSGLSGIFAENSMLISTLRQHLSSSERTPLLEAIAAEMLGDALKEAPSNTSNTQAQQAQELAEDAFNQARQAVWLVSRHCSAADLQAYKHMLWEIAQKVAQAAKEGGFLGIGGQQVNQAEKDMLERLASIVQPEQLD